MKPKIGTVVYTLYDNYIYTDIVQYVGRDDFLVEGFEMLTNYNRFSYSNFNKTWFRSLKKAKAALRQEFGRKKIYEVADGIYEMEVVF